MWWTLFLPLVRIHSICTGYYWIIAGCAIVLDVPDGIVDYLSLAPFVVTLHPSGNSWGLKLVSWQQRRQAVQQRVESQPPVTLPFAELSSRSNTEKNTYIQTGSSYFAQVFQSELKSCRVLRSRQNLLSETVWGACTSSNDTWRCHGIDIRIYPDSISPIFR